MKARILSFSTLVFCLIAYSQPCDDYQCDSIALRKFYIACGADSTNLDLSVWIKPGKRLEDFSINWSIDTLPEEIGLLTSLKYLSLAEIKMEYLPPSIGNLTNLEYLDLSHNLLEELPNETGRLTKLKHLDIRYNQLHTLPDSIVHLQAFEPMPDISRYYFFMSKNYICTMSDPVAKWVEKYAYRGQCDQLVVCPVCTTTAVRLPADGGFQPLRTTGHPFLTYDLRGKRIRNGTIATVSASRLPVGCYIADFGPGSPRGLQVTVR